MNNVPIFEPRETDHRRNIAQAVNQLIEGKTNAAGAFTLTANVTSTIVTNERVSESSHVSITATSANAAAALSGLYITSGSGQFTVTHASTATTDRTYTYLVATP